jgi:predicted amidohydrolase
MEVKPGLGDNLPRIIDHINREETDFILFPEMALTGYHGDFGREAVERAWDKIEAACRQNYTTGLVGTGAHDEDHVHIQTRIFSAEGGVLGTHNKIVPTMDDREWCRAGADLPVFEYRGLTFGCTICNDLWVTPGCGPYPDPRLTYQLGQKGALVIFHSVNSGTSAIHRDFHESNLRLRAMESGAWIVVANAAVPGEAINCPSGVMSPEGEWVAQCPLDGEHVFHYDIDLDLEIDGV